MIKKSITFKLVIYWVCMLTTSNAFSQVPTLSDLYNSIKAQESNFPLPQTDATIKAGTIDLDHTNVAVDRKRISFNFEIPTYVDKSYYTIYNAIPPNEQSDYPNHQTSIAEHILNKGGQVDIANILHLNIKFAIANWSKIATTGNIIIHLGAQVQTVPYGQTEVTFTNVSEINPVFSITINGFLTANGQPIPYELPGLLPFKINWSTFAAGAITIPVIPISIVYAPVADSQKKNQASSAISSTSGNISTVSFTTTNSTTMPVPSSFQSTVNMSKDMSAIGGALQKVPNPYVAAIGTALTVISSGLGTSTATQTNTTSTSNQNSVSISTTSTNVQTALSSQGGPGVGDIITYYYNARVLWFSDNGVMRLSVLGYDGFVQATAGQLKTQLTKMKKENINLKDNVFHLDTASLRSLLAVDPFVFGGPSAILSSPRFVNVSNGTVEVTGGGFNSSYTYQLSESDLFTTSNIKINVENDSPGFLSFLGLGVTENKTVLSQIGQSSSAQNSSSKSFTQQYNFNGNGTNENYTCEVYFDVVFGAFVFRDLTAKIATPIISGLVLQKDGKVLGNAQVTANVANKKFVTATDKKGQFKFKFETIKFGHVKLRTDSSEVQLELIGKPVNNIVIKSQ